MFGLFKKKQKNKNTELVCAEPAKLTIPFSEVPATVDIDEKRLIPITDSRVLSMISNVAPNMMQVVNSTKSTIEAIESVSGLGKIYRAVLPHGASDLFDSKVMVGAKRGGFLDASNNIGQANFVQVNGTVDNALQSVATNQAVSLAFNVASIIVGQYYMTQINFELDKISDNIDRISEFQHDQYLSKITSTIKELKEIFEYQSDILSSEDAIKREKEHLNRMKVKCTELLDQANHSINRLIGKPATDYKKYIRKTAEINEWYNYQKVLLELLLQISHLYQVFASGSEPIDKIFSVLNQCKIESEKVCELLLDYHSKKHKELGINLSKKTIDRNELMQKAADMLGREKLRFRNLPKADFDKISSQIKPFSFEYTTSLPEYNEDVVLIAKDGELYYLPNA